MRNTPSFVALLSFAIFAIALLAGANVAQAANLHLASIHTVDPDDRPPVSTCQAIADLKPVPPHRGLFRTANSIDGSPSIRVVNVALDGIDTDPLRPLATNEVRVSFYSHSTYIIESEAGVTAATDYFGFAQHKGQSLIPTIVTMNRAHSTHFTSNPDSRIKYVLPGWGQDEPASHFIQVDDILVRNVTTDIVRGEFRMPDTNSIFIFEVAGLCIGHLGHLHHRLTDEHFAQIGRLDVLMVPIDGAMTMSLNGMVDIVKRLRASVILPMHARGFATPETLISMLGDGFKSHYLDGQTIILTLNNLPKEPTVIIPRGL